MTKKTDKPLPPFMRLHKDIDDSFNRCHQALREITGEEKHNTMLIIVELKNLEKALMEPLAYIKRTVEVMEEADKACTALWRQAHLLSRGED